MKRTTKNFLTVIVIFPLFFFVDKHLVAWFLSFLPASVDSWKPLVGFFTWCFVGFWSCLIAVFVTTVIFGARKAVENKNKMKQRFANF